MATLLGMDLVTENSIGGHEMDDAKPLTLTRPEFVSIMERVLRILEGHFKPSEIERLLRFADTASTVSFGTWNAYPGCPLVQTRMVRDGFHGATDSVFSLFTEQFDGVMRETWGLDTGDIGLVTIL